MVEYTVAPSARGGNYRDMIDCPPILLLRLFGQPAKADEYKITGEFRFIGEDGNVFRLYDYKATTAYYDEEIYEDAYKFPSPEEFWASVQNKEFNLAGTADPEPFLEWLRGQILSTVTENVDALLEEARGYIAAGEDQKALDSINAAHQNYPNDLRLQDIPRVAELFLLGGEISVSLKRKLAAKTRLNRAIECFQQLGDKEGMARAVNALTQAELITSNRVLHEIK